MPIMTMLETRRPVGRHRRAVRRVGGRREVAEPVAGDQDLADDLLGGQVAHQLLRAGVAEGAGERAADLAREAERAAAFLGDVDGLDLDRPAGAARRKAQQPFARAVLGDLLGDDLRPGDGDSAPASAARSSFETLVMAPKVGDAAHVDPVPELAGAHAHLALGHADRGERRAEAVARQADQRRLVAGARSGQSVRRGSTRMRRRISRVVAAVATAARSR